MVPGFEIVWQFDVGAVESGDLAVGAADVADLDFALADLHRRAGVSSAAPSAETRCPSTPGGDVCPPPVKAS